MMAVNLIVKYTVVVRAEEFSTMFDFDDKEKAELVFQMAVESGMFRSVDMTGVCEKHHLMKSWGDEE
jgi:hypothetical protein